jgi:hypothetical protein
MHYFIANEEEEVLNFDINVAIQLNPTNYFSFLKYNFGRNFLNRNMTVVFTTFYLSKG